MKMICVCVLLFFAGCAVHTQSQNESVAVNWNRSVASNQNELNVNTGNQASNDNLQQRIDALNNAMVRLKPANFKELPSKIIKNLELRGCTVPQWSGLRRRHNVVSGEFVKRGQKDWAILCSRGGVSSILIYRNGSTEKISSIAKTDDIDYVQTGSGFSRVISAVDKAYIIEHHQAYDGQKPPPITHHGINDAYAEKGSTVRYFYGGKWLELQGAD